MKRERLIDLILRAGAAFALLFPAINAIFDSDAWIGYFPRFMRGIVPDPVLLHAFGAIEVVIALWLLSGKHLFWPASAATCLLAAVVLFNVNGFQVVFRDLSIAALTLALAIKHAHNPVDI